MFNVIDHLGKLIFILKISFGLVDLVYKLEHGYKGLQGFVPKTSLWGKPCRIPKSDKKNNRLNFC